MDDGNPSVFALESSRAFGEKLCEHLGVSLAQHEARDFADGEHKIRPLENVRDRDVYVVQSLYGDPERSVNDKLVRLLFFLGSLRDASAGRVTAVCPYLCYARKDRKTKTRDPVSTRYVASLFESVGVDRVITLDVHNLAAYQNAFRCPSEHLQGTMMFTDFFSPLLKDTSVVVVSPDVGGIKRAERFRQVLSHRLGRTVPTAFTEKHRSGGEVRGEAVVGPLEGRTAIILDDLISTGTTVVRAVEACRRKGAEAVYAVATHGLFTPPAGEQLDLPGLDRLVVTNTVPPFRLEGGPVLDKLEVLDASKLFARVLRRVREGRSVEDMFAIPPDRPD